ncbi:NUDIX hydrolase [Mesorhizobium erdmanii]|uniref:NUDIX hydrolase n=1 Tax=Mesorhizobium erdmanii TaxID=1777866 RepID=UPI0003F577D5|nr:membrane protein [Mesorhizobium erdmanii]
MDQTKGLRKHRANATTNKVKADLIAVVVAVNEIGPCVLTIAKGPALPSGPFELAHRSLQSGLRAWVELQTGQPLGYIEQLYTFADRDRIDANERVISISYLALTRQEDAGASGQPSWASWYDYFPWEDHRSGTPRMMLEELRPRLLEWAGNADDGATRFDRQRRAAVAFGFDDRPWNEDLTLQRYELLYEAALVEEATGDPNAAPTASASGKAMVADHRRILATGIARLRSKIKYRPVVFELMRPTFTLLQLQRAVEALAGRLINKPNFRRLVEQQELVEETGETSLDTGGRPAKLYRFRHAVLDERAAAGTKLPVMRP